MKILYSIQGTGNGHISRARDIIPILQKKCETDILVSGYQADMDLPFEVKYKLFGLSFIFGKKGGVDLRKTYAKSNTRRLIAEIKNLPVQDYDFVVNDFEPVSAWACLRKKVPVVSLSHQVSLLDKNVPKPSVKDAFGKFVLKNYAPAPLQIGLHFCRYSKDIYTPVIRHEIRNLVPTDEKHYTVYLPAYDDELLMSLLMEIPEVNWQVFSKFCDKVKMQNHITVQPITNQAFIQSLASSSGVLCGAGFETPAEALYLGKKLMVIPMQNQYEQQYNAAALQSMGVPTMRKLKLSNISKIKDWVLSDYKIEISYPDITEKIINRIFEMYVDGSMEKIKWSRLSGINFIPEL
jgi:uncharacterized protein (TIGR00661 family)